MMSFYQNPIVFSNIRGDLIYNRMREILREKIVQRKQGTNNFKFKNLESGHQLIDNVLFLKSPRTDEQSKSLDLATGPPSKVTSSNNV